MIQRIVILPWLGEFGWCIVQHVRFVQWHPAEDKIVCCEAGHECLFPSASRYFVDWEHPIPESERSGQGRWRDWEAREQYYASLRPRLENEFPAYEIIRPTYDCHWHMSDAPGFTFRPQARAWLPRVDVVLGPRRRSFDAMRNWPHWDRLARRLRDSGLSIGVVGRRETSCDLGADAYAWDHPDGDTAGSIDLLSRCDMYFGGDSGMSHLAALTQTPMVVMHSPPRASDMTGLMQRANNSWTRILPHEAWDDYTAVEDAVLQSIQQARQAAHYDLAVYATVDASVADWLEWIDALCARVGDESQQTGRRIVLRIQIVQATDEAIALVHRYRDSAHEIACVRIGHRPVAPLARPGEADRTIWLTQYHDPQTTPF